MFGRLLATILILAAAVGLLIVAWPQLFGLQQVALVAQLVSLRGATTAAAVLAIVIFMLVGMVSSGARRFVASLALLLLVFAAINAAVLSTRGFGDTSFETAGGEELTVLAWNTLGDAPGPDVIAKLALDSEADVVSLPETTNETGEDVAAIMEQAGRPMQVLTLAYDEVSRARSTTLLVSTELGEYSFDAEERTTSVLPTVVARPDNGSGPVLIAVHAVAPVQDQMDNWRDDLRWLGEACTGENVIMAGDFNATLDHLTGLASNAATTLGSCADAGVRSNNGAVGTWPAAAPALLGAPIDHVMATTNWRVSGMRVIETHDKRGSDHRPVLVQLSPSAR